MKKLMMFAAMPVLALTAACGEDSAIEEENYGDDQAGALEEMADEMPTDAGEDALNARAEEIDDIGDDRADALNERADEME